MQELYKHTGLRSFISWITVFSAFLLTLFALYSQDAKKPKEAEDEPIKIDSDVASKLEASLLPDGASIQLKWSPPVDEGEVIIARSLDMINTAEKLYIADSLGKFKSDKNNLFNTYTDINLKPGKYYYAVVMVSQVKKKRVKLYAGQNFTTIPILVQETPTEPAKIVDKDPVKEPVTKSPDQTDFVTNLRAVKTNDHVRLNWDSPAEAEKTIPTYTIYRSSVPLNTLDHFAKAQKLGDVLHPETVFVDKALPGNGTFYYGVSVTTHNKEHLPLVENKSFVEHHILKDTPPVTVTPPAVKEEKKEVVPVKEPEEERIKTAHISNIRSERVKDGVLITWDTPPQARDGETTYTIYKSALPMSGQYNSLILGKSKKLGVVLHPDNAFFYPINDLKQESFYGVVSKNPEDEEDWNLVENESYLKVGPLGKMAIKEKEPEAKKTDSDKKEEPKPVSPEVLVKKDEPKKEPVKKEPVNTEPKKLTGSEDEFTKIMKDYYKQGKYNSGAKKFRELALATEDPALRAKSLFYEAMCYYQKREYKKALKILLREEVRTNYDRERVDFYTKRCVEFRGE